MKRLFKFLLYVVMVISPLLPARAQQPAGCNEGRIVRFVTYNVGAFSKEKEDSTPRVAEFLLGVDAEAVGLNEVDSCNARHNVDQLAILAELLGSGWQHQYGRAMPYLGGAYGNGIVSKSNILDGGVISLPRLDGCEMRSCVYIETKDYVFADLHLDHISEAARLAQLEIVTNYLKGLYAKSGKPVFLAGDFNAEPGEATIRQAGQDWVILTPADPSYPAKQPRICIDYIMILKGSGPVEVLRSGSITPTALLSDHLPVFIEVRLPALANNCPAGL